MKMEPIFFTRAPFFLSSPDVIFAHADLYKTDLHVVLVQLGLKLFRKQLSQIELTWFQC